MTVQRTLSIIKPDATKRNIVGKVLDLIESSGLRIIAQRRMLLTVQQAESFYAIHRERPFFQDLVQYMSSGPIVVQALEGEDAVEKYREVMGATDPAAADDGTIRQCYGLDIQNNTVHGSDSLENAEQEIAFFFASTDLIS